jgi:hypothetical protein
MWVDRKIIAAVLILAWPGFDLSLANAAESQDSRPADMAIDLHIHASPDIWIKAARRGVLLIFRANDTLDGLYTDIYRGVTPPPIAMVKALNPNVKPGDIVVFPPPATGWKR